MDLLATFDERFESGEAVSETNETGDGSSACTAANAISRTVEAETVVKRAPGDAPMLDPTLLLEPSGGDESAPPPLKEDKNEVARSD